MLHFHLITGLLSHGKIIDYNQRLSNFFYMGHAISLLAWIILQHIPFDRVKNALQYELLFIGNRPQKYLVIQIFL